MSYEKYVGSAMGRTFLISGIISLVLLYLTFIIPLAPYEESAWYSFLYEDVTLNVEDRFNWALMILEAALFGLFYFFFALTLASYTELQNQIPSWSQLVYSGLLTLVLAWIVPKISVGEGSIDEVSGTGYNHFTPGMQTGVLLLTILFMGVLTAYFYYSEEKK